MMDLSQFQSAWCARLCFTVISTFSFGVSVAQTSRDPTVPPPEATMILGGDAVALPSAPPLGDGMAVVRRDGKTYLVVGTRLYAPGEQVAGMKLVRITETEVWLQDGQTQHKVPRFSGIVRTPSQAEKVPARRQPTKPLP